MNSPETIEELKKSDRIIFEVTAGSMAYGTYIEDKSDEDIRGIYRNTKSDYLGLGDPLLQISDERHDTTYYSLKRFFELATTANPNLIELLWMPEDCIRIETKIMIELMKYRHLFITKKCYDTHASYAHGQIKKAKGQNKWVNNPKPKDSPLKEDFCWFIPRNQYFVKAPARPIPVSSINLDLREYHVASLEHSHNMYRLYHYGKGAKGVFRGDGMLVCESIPKNDEWKRFKGILIYNQDAYEKAKKEWGQYWQWVKNRNPFRWISQENNHIDYDPKNMAHCLRLLISCEHIFEHGAPLVRFEGEILQKIRNIREGYATYDNIMEEVNERKAKVKRLYELSDLPEKVDFDRIDDLYRFLMHID